MGEVSRPKPEVLPASALIPTSNLIEPAPNQFTHEIARQAPFYYTASDEGRPPDGTFARGTPVVLLHDGGGGRCYVADGRGLYVVVDRKALRRLGTE
ncbi:MAG: hypothetical protein U0X20_15355 [Caldilineaceae bacterium]